MENWARECRSLDMQRQTCKACGYRDKFDFHVPDVIWKAIVPERFVNHVVCLTCFDDFARLKGVDYAPYLRAVYFAGEAAAFELCVVSAVPLD